MPFILGFLGLALYTNSPRFQAWADSQIAKLRPFRTGRLTPTPEFWPFSTRSTHTPKTNPQ